MNIIPLLACLAPYVARSNEEPEFFAQTPSRKVGIIEL
jgi:hypothetical protein